eukprot:COSAG01_NODE_2417_length_7736_cov_7.862511_6_plen_121_part_00
MWRPFLSRSIETQRTRVATARRRCLLTGTAAAAAAAVSHSCACIGSPCLRHCVHGASIGGGGAEGQALCQPDGGFTGAECLEVPCPLHGVMDASVRGAVSSHIYHRRIDYQSVAGGGVCI